MTIGNRNGRVRPARTALVLILQVVALGLLCGQVDGAIISQYGRVFDVHEADVAGVNQLLDATDGRPGLLSVVDNICVARRRDTPLHPLYGVYSVHETAWGGARNVILWAAIHGKYAALSVLVQVPGVVIDTRDDLVRQWAPLHYAASLGDLASVQILLGCPSASLEVVETQDATGQTPLHLAAQQGHFDVVRALIAYTDNQGQGIQVSRPDSYSDTPLYLATANGRTGVVRLLRESGRVASEDLNHVYNVARRHLSLCTPYVGTC
ncbi:Ankyrin repeat domain-containing protein [Plasmodiophora brassicae]